jgi:hypothetical protein
MSICFAAIRKPESPYLLRRERVENLRAERIPSETGSA